MELFLIVFASVFSVMNLLGTLPIFVGFIVIAIGIEYISSSIMTLLAKTF